MDIFTDIFTEIWPLLSDLFKITNHQANIIENMIQIIKFFMRALKTSFLPYINNYIALVIEGYSQVPIPSYLYAFEILITVFSKKTETIEIIKFMFKQMFMQTFTVYLTKKEDYNANPGLTEDFFGLLFRIIKINPNVVFECGFFSELIGICINNINIEHIETSKNIIYTLNRLVKLNNFDEHSQAVIRNLFITNKIGNLLIKNIFDYMIAVPPGIIIENLKELIDNLIINFKEECAIWFAENLINIPHDCLTNNEKLDLVNIVKDYNQDHLDELLDNFNRRCLSRFYRKDK